MSYLVDTNVLSELRRKQPDARVVTWMEQRPTQALYLSVLTLGEIRKGIERLQGDARQAALLDWLEVELPRFFWAACWRWTRIPPTAGAACKAVRAAHCPPSTACWQLRRCNMT